MMYSTGRYSMWKGSIYTQTLRWCVTTIRLHPQRQDFNFVNAPKLLFVLMCKACTSGDATPPVLLHASGNLSSVLPRLAALACSKRVNFVSIRSGRKATSIAPATTINPKGVDDVCMSCVDMYVWMYVCMCGCMYGWMDGWMYQVCDGVEGEGDGAAELTDG